MKNDFFSLFSRTQTSLLTVSQNEQKANNRIAFNRFIYTVHTIDTQITSMLVENMRVSSVRCRRQKQIIIKQFEIYKKNYLYFLLLLRWNKIRLAGRTDVDFVLPMCICNVRTVHGRYTAQAYTVRQASGVDREPASGEQMNRATYVCV